MWACIRNVYQSLTNTTHAMVSEWDIVYTAIAIQGGMIFLANSIALLVCLKSKNLERVLFSNVIFTLLFTSHVFCGLLNIFVAVMEIRSRRTTTTDSARQDITKQGAHIARDLFGGFEVIFTIFNSLERYVAIRYPLFYSRLDTKYGVVAIMIAIFIPVGFTVWRTFSTDAFLVVSVVTFVGAIAVTVSNLTLYRSIKRHCAQISQNVVAYSAAQEVQQKLQLEHRKLKGLFICVSISASFLVSWFPVGIKFMVKFLLGIIKRRYYWDVLFSIVVFSNSLWDVFIFFYNKKSARHTLRNFLRKHRNAET